MGRVVARPIWTADCETDPFKAGRIPAPFVWGLFDGDSFYHFATAVEFIRFVANQRVLIYAHNGGKFDYHFLREYINSDQPVVGINGRLAKFYIGEAEFRDSLNILPVSLKTFAKDEIDYSIMEPEARDIPKNRETILKYLQSDCVYLHEFVTAFNTKYKGRPLTQAGNSMRQWSKISGIKPPKQSAVDYARFKSYYYGGRVQAFKMGAARCAFRVADINSAYPRAMLDHHPISTTFDIDEHLPPEPKLATSFIRLECTSRGALPWRDEKGALRFPDDEKTVRDYCITGHEFLAAMEFDALKNIVIREVLTPHQTTDFPHIGKIYEERQKAKAEGRKADEIFAKLQMNSLYGKFGANPNNYEEFVICTSDSRLAWEDEGYEEMSAFGEERFMLRRPLAEEKHRYYNCATAASITGSVRAKMYRSLMKCSGLIYCDTDSIAAEDISGLDMGPELGQWKDEGAYDEYAVAGKKMYAFHAADKPRTFSPVADHPENKHWKVAHKGVKITPEEIIRVAQGEVLTYRPEAPSFSITRNQPVFINRQIRVTR